MKKITLLAVLMWSSIFYAQTYIDEGFEGVTFPPTGWADVAGAGDTNGYPWEAVESYTTTSGDFIPIKGTKSAFYNQLFNISHGEILPGDPKDKWLISKSMDLTSATSPELTYYEAVRHPDFPATQGVYYSTDYDGTNASPVAVAVADIKAGLTYTVVSLGDTPIGDWLSLGWVGAPTFIATMDGTGIPGTGTTTNTATWTAINTAFDFADSTPGPAEEYVWKYRGTFDLSAANGNANVYIGFHYESADDESEWFIDSVLVREPPSCYEPTAGVISSTTFESATFDWTPNDPGDDTWDVELVDVTAGQVHEVDGVVTTGVTPTPTTTFSSLAALNDYEAYVRTDCGSIAAGFFEIGGIYAIEAVGDTDFTLIGALDNVIGTEFIATGVGTGTGTARSKSVWSGPFAFLTAPTNNECGNAISVTHQSNVVTAGGASPNSGNVDGATDSGIPAAAGASGTPNNDVWFTFTAGYGGVSITVEPNAALDPVIELFEGTCGALVSRGFQDGPGNGGTETLIDDTVVFGTVYHVRVYHWDATLPADGSFDIKVYRGSIALQVEELDKNEFSFYPNPVQDRLNLKSPSDIEHISVYNMLGQEIMRQAPNSRTTEVDMSALQTGAYFVKVTINGITETKQIIKR